MTRDSQTDSFPASLREIKAHITSDEIVVKIDQAALTDGERPLTAEVKRWRKITEQKMNIFSPPPIRGVEYIPAGALRMEAYKPSEHPEVFAIEDEVRDKYQREVQASFQSNILPYLLAVVVSNHRVEDLHGNAQFYSLAQAIEMHWEERKALFKDSIFSKPSDDSLLRDCISSRLTMADVAESMRMAASLADVLQHSAPDLLEKVTGDQLNYINKEHNDHYHTRDKHFISYKPLPGAPLNIEVDFDTFLTVSQYLFSRQDDHGLGVTETARHALDAFQNRLSPEEHDTIYNPRLTGEAMDAYIRRFHEEVKTPDSPPAQMIGWILDDPDQRMVLIGGNMATQFKLTYLPRDHPLNRSSHGFATDETYHDPLSTRLSDPSYPVCYVATGHTPLYCAAEELLHQAVEKIYQNGIDPFPPANGEPSSRELLITYCLEKDIERPKSGYMPMAYEPYELCGEYTVKVAKSMLHGGSSLARDYPGVALYINKVTAKDFERVKNGLPLEEIDLADFKRQVDEIPSDPPGDNAARAARPRTDRPLE